MVGEALYILMPMVVASFTAMGGMAHGMKSGSRMYCPKAKEMTAMAAGLQEDSEDKLAVRKESNRKHCQLFSSKTDCTTNNHLRPYRRFFRDVEGGFCSDHGTVDSNYAWDSSVRIRTSRK